MNEVKVAEPMRDAWVITDGNACGGIAYTQDEAQDIKANTTNGLGQPLFRDGYDIIHIHLAFNRDFEEWYNKTMYDGGEDIYCTDGDCLLAGVEGDEVIDARYLIGNIEWLIETDESNIRSWKESGDPDGYIPSARKHIRWCKRVIDEMRKRAK